MNWDVILQEAKADVLLAGLVDVVQEYAQIYLLAKQRHKGCDGKGDLMTLKEEFKDTVDNMVRHCKENGYLSGACEYDPDSAVAALVNTSR